MNEEFEVEATPGMAGRFRGYLPVVVDVETTGLDCRHHAILEIAAIPLRMRSSGLLEPGEVFHAHVEKFAGAKEDPRSMEINGIRPDNPFRMARPESEVLNDLFRFVKQARRDAQCKRAILVGHNAPFDLGFVNAATDRCGKRNKNPFHLFSCLDTVSLSALAYGQTVLARACECAGIGFSQDEAHSAKYDTQKTAELFCAIFNQWERLTTISESFDAESEYQSR